MTTKKPEIKILWTFYINDDIMRIVNFPNYIHTKPGFTEKTGLKQKKQSAANDCLFFIFTKKQELVF